MIRANVTVSGAKQKELMKAEVEGVSISSALTRIGRVIREARKFKGAVDILMHWRDIEIHIKKTPTNKVAENVK